MTAATRHAERRAPFALRAFVSALCPGARVDVRAARHQELDHLEMSFPACLNQRVLILSNNLIDMRATIEQHSDDVEMPLARGHDQGISVAGNGEIRISASIEQKRDDRDLAFTRSDD